MMISLSYKLSSNTKEKIVSNNWNFPSNNGGQINGIANAGIETFNGKLIQSIARENCQNSLDAIRDGETCAIVKFTTKKINAYNFPQKENFSNKLKKACDYWRGNEKATEFLQRALRTIEKPQLDVLIISDYNTTGLLGPFSNSVDSSWNSLTKLDGGATKSGNTGGSYGIGKNAPFANSNFRTIFYRTKNIDGEIAAQGISRIISYPEDLTNPIDTMTTGVGYFGDVYGNKPVNKIEELDSIDERKDIGTDVFIFGFHNEPGWKVEMIEEILKNFLVAIFNEKLIVYIDELEISKNTLNRCVNAYIKDKKGKDFRSCYSSYLVLTSPKTEIITKKFHNLGELELKLLIDPTLDLDRRILRVRKTGMKLFARNSVSKVIMYSAILELKGDSIGSYFLKLEPPTHDKWEYDRANDKKYEAKSFIKEIEDWEELIIQEKGKNSDTQELGVSGLSDFLTFNGGNGPKQSREDLIDTVEKIAITQKSKGFISNGRLYLLDGDAKNKREKEQVAGEIAEDGGNSGVRKLKGERPRKKIESHKAKPKAEGEDIANIVRENINKKELDRLRIIKLSDCKYKMSFFVPANINKGYINVLSIGENNKPKKICIKNSSPIKNISNIKVVDSSINFNDILPGERTEIIFEVADNRNYAMEVEVYEHI